MRRFKKTRNISNLGKPPEPNKKNQILTATVIIGLVLIAFGLIYAYSVYKPRWAESEALTLLASSSDQDRIAGMKIIARNRLEQHTARLCEMLRDDPSINVRKAAPASIIRLRDDRAVPALVFALGDQSDDVAKAAMDALQKRYGSGLQWDTLLDWWNKHKSKFDSIADLPDGPPIVATMSDMLSDDKYYVRLAAVNRLARLQHPAVKPVLQPLTDDPNETVRKAVRQALAAIDSAAEQAQ